MAGRTLDAGLHLLDRQLLDTNGRMAGKVDDLELTRLPSGQWVVTSILSGPGALASRIGGFVGAALAGLSGRLAGRPDNRPARVPFGAVKALGNHVELARRREDLESFVFEAWMERHVIGRIPGASERSDDAASEDLTVTETGAPAGGAGDAGGTEPGRPVRRLSALLGPPVHDERGDLLGHVHDVRLVQDGPVTGAFGAALRVEGLVIGAGATADRLGYDRAGVRGPWVVKAVFARLRSSSHFVPWDRVRSVDPDRIDITGRGDDLQHPEPLVEEG